MPLRRSRRPGTFWPTHAIREDGSSGYAEALDPASLDAPASEITMKGG